MSTQRGAKREAIMRAIQVAPTSLNSREIAAAVGCHPTYVTHVIQHLPESVIQHLPQTILGKDGKVYPARQTRRRPSGLDRSPGAALRRRQQIRVMAAEGYTSRQIASEVGISIEGCHAILRQEGIDLPGDRATGRARVHVATRIVEHIVMDAENLTTEIKLIDFGTLPPARLADWIESLEQSRLNIGSFIRQLRRISNEADRRGDTERSDPEATPSSSVESASGPAGDDAGTAGGVDAT